MPEFRTTDIGQVMQTAEALKGMKREAENDRVRNLYMGEQVKQMEASRNAAAVEAQTNAQNLDWKRLASAAASIEASQNPTATVQQQFPEFIQNYEAKHGAGSWAQLSNDDVKREAGGLKAHALAQLGVMPEKQDVESFGQPQEIVLDGQPAVVQLGNRGTIKRIEGGTPYNKPKGPGASITTPDGTTVTLGGDGVPNYGGVGLSKPNASKLQETFINTQGSAYQLREQMAKWNPEFSTYGGQAKAAIAAGKEKFGMDNAPQQAKFLADYTSWKADTSALMSDYIKTISGTAASEPEVVRLKAGMPNDNDSPTQYKAKAEATMRRFSLVQARAAYLLSNPAQSLDSVSLDKMSGIVTQEANRLAQSYAKAGMPEDQARQRAIAETQTRFGMGQ